MRLGLFMFSIVCLGVLSFTEAINVEPFIEDKIEEAALLQQALAEEEPDYPENAIDNLFRGPQQEKRASWSSVFRRACVRRNGNCDHRPNDCCFSSSCRCNLWGSNCRCQRVGLFQKWGKKK